MEQVAIGTLGGNWRVGGRGGGGAGGGFPTAIFLVWLDDALVKISFSMRLPPGNGGVLCYCS